MFILVTGGSGSGKSEFAENIANRVTAQAVKQELRRNSPVEMVNTWFPL